MVFTKAQNQILILKKNQNPVQSTMNTKTEKTEVFWHRNLKTTLKNSQNCKTKNPMPFSLQLLYMYLATHHSNAAPQSL